MFEWHIPSCLGGHFLGIRRGVEEQVTFYYVYKRFFYFCHVLKFLFERFLHLCSGLRRFLFLVRRGTGRRTELM